MPGFKYFSQSDMLDIALADKPSVESKEVHEGFVFDFDAEGKVVSIEIDCAKDRIDLEAILAAGLVIDDSGPPQRIFTTSELAEEVGLTVFAVQKIRKAMKEAGIEVGIRPDLPDSLMSEDDLARIQEWRESHPRGRPRRAAAEA